jgi:hypothetical protein
MFSKDKIQHFSKLPQRRNSLITSDATLTPFGNFVTSVAGKLAKKAGVVKDLPLTDRTV